MASIQGNQASLLVKQLSTLSPLNRLQHLKRVRKPEQPAAFLEIIICPLRRRCSRADQSDSPLEDTVHRVWTEDKLAAEQVPEFVQTLIFEQQLLLRTARVRHFIVALPMKRCPLHIATLFVHTSSRLCQYFMDA